MKLTTQRILIILTVAFTVCLSVVSADASADTRFVSQSIYEGLRLSYESG